MNAVRRLLLVIVSPLFIILLLATAFDIGFVSTATHPSDVKQLLSDSGLYESMVPSLLQQQKVVNTSLGTFSTNDALVQQAVQQAVPASEVKRQINGAVDNIYAWLDGRIARPDFKISLSTTQTGFADSISNTVKQRLSKLPPCTTAESLTLAASGQIDIEKLDCLPPGTTADGLSGQVRKIILGTNFLSSINFSAADVKDSSGRPLFQTAGTQKVPKQYQRFEKSPAVLVTLTVIFGAAIFFLSRGWRSGLRHLGIGLLAAGVILLLAAIVITDASATDIASKLKLDNQLLQQSVQNLISRIGIDVSRNYTWFGVGYLIAGLIVGGLSFVSRKQNQGAEHPLV
jgi:hypothetical protein